MKNLFTLLAAVAFVACSSSDDAAPKSISLTDGTSKTQTVYADQTSAGDGIHFKADADWEAQVDAVQTKGGSNVPWIQLDRYNGTAGEYTLAVTIEPNTSGNSRSAKIVIVCGTDKITILVEQKSTTESGEVPAEKKMISRIQGTFSNSSDKDGAPRKADYIFTYNDQMKLSQVSGLVWGYADEVRYTFTYETNSIRANKVRTKEGTVTTDQTTYSLHSDGTVKSFSNLMDEQQNGEVIYRCTGSASMTYDQGYLVLMSEAYASMSGGVTTVDKVSSEFMWKNDCLTQVVETGNSTTTYEYTAEGIEQPWSFDLLMVFGDGELQCDHIPANFGMKSKGLLRKATTRDLATSKVVFESTYSYEYNEQDVVSKITVETSDDDGSGDTYTTKSIYEIEYLN